MKTNKSLAKAMKLTAALLELHNENPFKIKSYSNAYSLIKKWPIEFQTLLPEEIESIKGIGKGLRDNILSFLASNTFDELKDLLIRTPEGVVELLSIPGLGAKKVGTIWREMGIENPGSLLYACNENRLVEYKGFGAKTQNTLRDKILYYFANKGKMLYPEALLYMEETLKEINERHSERILLIAGETFHKNQIVENFCALTFIAPEEIQLSKEQVLTKKSNQFYIEQEGKPPIELIPLDNNTNKEIVNTKIFNISKDLLPYCKGYDSFISDVNKTKDLQKSFGLYCQHKIPTAFPELGNTYVEGYDLPNLVKRSDLKGLIHLHTNYSDGMNTLEEMAESAINEGFGYMVVTDHSKIAFYANGLSEERLLQQMEHIDQLNSKYGNNFKIVKGVECDILSNGNLDYSNEILALLDIVIISVHSNLNMEEEQATKRIIKAIENPNAHILGHSCGRILLSRKGYPLQYSKIFEACAKNNVAIELNANPQRLDLDYRLINQALEKEIKISINPDAHNKNSIKDIEYGITAARKGGLTRENCLNCLEPLDLLGFFGKI